MVKNANNSGAGAGQPPATGGVKDAGKSAGEIAGQARDTGRSDNGSEILRRQLEQAAAQKFGGDIAGAANFMKHAGKAMARAESEGRVPKAQGRERPQEQESSRSRDDDRGR